MRVSLSWQKKAIIVLALTLIFLSAVLAAMAIREAERARLVSEREVEDAQRRAAASVSDRAQSLLAGLESRVLLALPASRTELSSGELAAASRRILSDPDNSGLLFEVFFADAAGNIVYPAAKPLFLFPGERADLREIPAELASNESWRAAEDSELRRKDYAAAAAAYQGLLGRSWSRDSRPFIFFRLGRCSERAGNLARALSSFKSVLDAGRPDLSTDGIPLELMAVVQTAEIYLRAGREAEAASAFFALLDRLLAARWSLSRSRFEFYLDRAEGQLRTILAVSKSPELEERRSRSNIQRETALRRMAHLENIRQRILPLIVPGRQRPTAPDLGFSRISALQGQDLLLVSYRPLDDDAALGLVIDPDALAARLLPASLGPPVSQSRWLIRVEEASGRALAGGELPTIRPPGEPLRPSFSGSFADDFPPWAIAIYPTAPDRSLRDFRAKRAVYILFVAVVMTALFLGGYLAIRGTAKEFELARLKSDFVSTVSHDFRTPLTSIRYLAELLERGRVKDEERRRDYYKTIGAESERLDRLVENILDFSKIEAGMKEFRMEATDIAALVRDVAARFLGQTVQRGVNLQAEIPQRLPSVLADPEALSRAVLNLLDNAEKYSGESPWIGLRAWAEAADICLEVEDRGIGISPEDQKKVFEKFFRSKAGAAGTVRGSGIGLTLVGQIVKAHGGRVALESELGRGTKVTIRLPAGPQQGQKEGVDE